MARNYSRKRRPRSRSSTNVGQEIAKRHIREAEELTKELGGTDQDVKKFFFSLKDEELEKILLKYQELHGEKASDYAWETIPKWKSGRTKMSGMVASRLFALLPVYMKTSDKLGLVESLWKHVGPEKKVIVLAGKQSSIADVLETVKVEVEKLTTNWKIPDTLEARFQWLSQKDSTVYQELLSHIKERERSVGVEVISTQIPELKNKLQKSWSETTSRLSYIIDVGKQSVELRFEGNGSQISVVEAASLINKTDGGKGPIWILIIIALIIAAALIS